MKSSSDTPSLFTTPFEKTMLFSVSTPLGSCCLVSYRVFVSGVARASLLPFAICIQYTYIMHMLQVKKCIFYAGVVFLVFTCLAVKPSVKISSTRCAGFCPLLSATLLTFNAKGFGTRKLKTSVSSAVCFLLIYKI